MFAFFKSMTKDIVGAALLAVVLLIYFRMDHTKGFLSFSIPNSVLDFHTIFLSIILEAFPFILLGVFVSALIQVFVSEETLHRFLPKNPWLSLIPATLLAAVFPVCECAIVPVIRRLIKKGMPMHVGVIFMVAAPILNPVTVASTYFAFRSQLVIVYARFILGFLITIIVGAVIYLLFRNRPQLKRDKDELIGKQEIQPSPHRQPNRLRLAFFHAADEFFDTGKYLIAGAAVAALFQTYFDRNLLVSISSHETSSTLTMMVFAYFISLCSQADAFVAASLSSKFSHSSVLAFLVFGPMLDLKTTIMLFAYFRTKFVLIFIATIILVVFTAVMFAHNYIL